MTFLDLVKSRYSVRSYTEQPVEDEKLNYLLECARLAPSAVNKQPWKFIIVKSEEGKNKIHQCYGREWITEAPLYIIICAVEPEAWTRRYDNKNHADIDASIAIEHICLAAAEQELGSCWVCNFRTELIQELFQFEKGTHPVAILPIGYPQNQEMPEKSRKNISEIVSYI